MENKELVPENKISEELAGWYILWSVILSYVYNVFYLYVLSRVFKHNIILLLAIALALQVFMHLVVSTIAISKTFKKKTMKKSEVPTLMVKIMLFTFVIFAINSANKMSNIDENIQKELNDNIQYRMYDTYAERLLSSEEYEEYERLKEEKIEEAKKRLRKTNMIFDTMLIPICLGVSWIQKPVLLKKSIDEQEKEEPESFTNSIICRIT